VVVVVVKRVGVLLLEDGAGAGVVERAIVIVVEVGGV
jgi:hypothetical protein